MNKLTLTILILNLLIVLGCSAQVNLTKIDSNSINLSERKATRIKSVTCENNIIKFQGNGLLSYNFEKLLNGRLSIDFYNVSAVTIKIDKNCKDIVSGPATIGHTKVNFTIFLKNNVEDNFLIKKGNIKENNHNVQVVYNYVNNVYVSDIKNKKIYKEINKLGNNQYILNKEISFISDIFEVYDKKSTDINNKKNIEDNQKIELVFSNPIKVIESVDKKDYISVKIQGNIGFIKNIKDMKKLNGKIFKEIDIKNDKNFSYINIYRLNKKSKEYISIDTVNNHLVIYSTVNNKF